MIRKALALCLALVTVPVIGATIDTPPPPDINAYLSPKATDKHGLNDTLWQLLNDAGQTVGFRGGKAQRAWELQQALSIQNDDLNRLYTFAPLISRQGWLPPVIVAAESLANITDNQIRTANKTYTILVKERFVSNPPSWRQYLLAGLAVNTDIPTEIAPKNGAEEKVWRAAIEKGWQEGRESADRTLESNFNRLTRDYAGMVRYSTLVQQGMITLPVVSEQLQSVTGSQDKLMLGDKVRDLKQRAGFELDKKRWKPIITTQQ
ncbi:TPA: type IV secretory system conjugative DNA transfer family protein [Yersinia enterocolitica]|uniref:Conjugal transfer protein n=2 Tax=Yersinia TaxID=629 RepID=A0ABM6V084_9GAMM|nr:MULTISPECIES: type IV secretory system conjugative DNA transfer family protein [Yersinia]EKN5031185.1 conjugal transfer protein [Yersinia enterocolitica]OVZ88186.1 conjugal transfer protein [Yersinia frederiksenii]AVX40656.1 conjugal transfer protein [Yersinia massiliensis]EKN6368068.1 conjugal transfer protein [Yersinia enterocolitica]MCB5319923.1 type IV secretion system DotC family protein [Yersinia massiliensis]